MNPREPSADRREPRLSRESEDRFRKWMSALLVAVVVVVVGAVELYLRWNPPAPMPSPVEGIGGSVNLTAPSRLQLHELVLGTALLLVRLVMARWRRWALEPWLDLPILGLMIAVTGGGFSPLESALPLAYVAALVFLRRETGPTRSRTVLGLQLLVGFAGLHFLVAHHDRHRLQEAEQRQTQVLEESIQELRKEQTRPIGSLESHFEDFEIPRPAPGLQKLFDPLRETQDALREFLENLSSRQTVADFLALSETLQNTVQACRESYYEASSQWVESGSSDPWKRDIECRDINETQSNILHEIEREISLLQFSVVEVDRTRQRLEGLQQSGAQRRAVIAVATCLFALLAFSLRQHLSETVSRVQKEQSRREIELREEEKNHWVAVTAGLTHGLGNDILAYDIYLGEILDKLGKNPSEPNRGVLDRLQFLKHSNKGRLGFLKFLEAFAQQHKAIAEGRPLELPVTDLHLPPLLHQVREHLAEVETADLPPLGSDPVVDRQIRRFRDLPLEIDVEPEGAAVLHRGHRGVMEFFAYELFKNALRSATGERALRVELRRTETALLWRVINDVQIDEETGTCPNCSRSPGPLRRVRRRRDERAVCADCFPAHLQQILAHSFEPGRGGGTGLGLFLIRYFLATYAGGSVDASVHDSKIPEVAFQITIPDRSNGDERRPLDPQDPGTVAS